MQKSFTCCVGTGMENHALHGDGIYYESADTVWVNIFAPSTAELSSGAKVSMESDFPDGDTAKLAFTVPRGSQTFTLQLRRPGWAGDAFAVKVNGQRIDVPPVASLRVGGAGGRDLGFDAGTLPSSYVSIARAWKTGDVVEVAIPKSLRLEPTPDDKSVAAIMWGPLVIAGDLGPRRQGPGSSPITPLALVAANGPVDSWVLPVGDHVGNFRANGVARSLSSPSNPASSVVLAPFYRTHGRTYAVYFDVLTPSGFDAKVASRAADAERQRRLEAATVGSIRPGDAANEQTVNYRSEPADRPVIRTNNRTARGGPGWLSYDLPVDGSADSAVVVTYFNDLGLPVVTDFRILVDGTAIARYTPNREAAEFWDAVYPVPSALASGKNKITVRFEAPANERIAPIYAVRVVRAKGM